MYYCKEYKKKMTIKECEMCFLKNKDKQEKYQTRAMCKLNNTEWLKQLKEIENKQGNYTEEDISFLKYCKRNKIISYAEGEQYKFNQDFLKFYRELIN